MTRWPKGNVVVPVDLSVESFAAVDTALELVTCPDQVRVLHVRKELPVS